MTFDGRGTGFMLVGENGGGVKADIYVDGVKKAENAENNSSSKRYSTIVLDGLASGDHTFKVVVKSGTLVIDGVYILGEVLPGGSIEALKLWRPNVKRTGRQTIPPTTGKSSQMR